MQFMARRRGLAMQLMVEGESQGTDGRTRARDADGDVQVGRDNLARLPDLHVVRTHAGVDGGARGAHRRVQLEREAVEHRKVVASLEAAAARDNRLGRGEFWTVALGNLLADPRRRAGRREVDGGGGDSGGSALRRRLVEGRGAHSHDLDGILRLDGGEGVAGVDGTNEGVLALDADDVRHLRHVKQRRHPREEPLAEGGGARDDVREARLCDSLHQRGPLLRHAVVERVVVDELHRVHAIRLGRRRGHLRRAADEKRNGLHLRARGDGGERALGELGAVVLGDQQRRGVAPGARERAGALGGSAKGTLHCSRLPA
mmetsp:Transcript_22481/g.63857  ORF Transcript_22481/g.63857 Transcript_22481/m.63857 type:complete len:316 (+) Transcript_22481:688-1635(+)